MTDAEDTGGAPSSPVWRVDEDAAQRRAACLQRAEQEREPVWWTAPRPRRVKRGTTWVCKCVGGA